MAAVIELPQKSKWAKRDNQPPLRQPNQASRTREYLTPDEVGRMITAAGSGRLERDALLIMMAYRHGLRASLGGNSAPRVNRHRIVRDLLEQNERNHLRYHEEDCNVDFH
jgi:hypothetical protein